MFVRMRRGESEIRGGRDVRPSHELREDNKDLITNTRE